MVNPKNTCKLIFSDYLWIPFLDQPQLYFVVFAMIYPQICKVILTKLRHEIGPNDIFTLNEKLKNIST